MTQLRIKGGGVVIIYLGPFFQSLAVLTLIVIVMADDGDFRAEMLFQMPGEGGFAGARYRRRYRSGWYS